MGLDDDTGSGAREPGYVEDESGATLDSGTAICRFNTEVGGRLERWKAKRGSDHGQDMAALEDIVGAIPSGPQSLTSYDLVDSYGGALVDHFWPLGTRPADVAAGTQQEYGDFVGGPYKSQVVNSGGEIRIGLLRDGEIRAGQRVAEVRMAKSAAVRPLASDVSVLYRVINSSTRPLQILFAVEFNLYAPGLAGQEEYGDAYYLVDGERPEDASLASMDVSPDATTAALVNPSAGLALQMGWDRQCDLWRMPGTSPERGVRLFTVWRIQLPPRDNWALGLWLALS